LAIAAKSERLAESALNLSASKLLVKKSYFPERENSMNRRLSRRVNRTLAMSAALVLGKAAAGWAAPESYDFTGASGGGWSTATNWTQVANNTIHTVPLIGDTAILGETGTALSTVYVNFNQSYTGAGLASLVLDSTAIESIILEQTLASTMIATNELIGTTISINAYNQSAGTNTVNGTLAISQTAGITENSYTLSGSGTLNAANELVGQAGTGSFVQSGGLNTFTDFLELGDTSTSDGSYALSGGTLTTTDGGYEFLGNLAGSTGTFSQTGGVHTIDIGAFVVGYMGAGNYGLTAGTLNINSTAEDIGYTGTGTFNQTGGTHNVAGGFLLLGGSGGNFAQQGVGYYNLMGGTLTSTNGAGEGEYVGDDGVGVMTQSGGANDISSGSNLDVGVDAGSYGAYTLNGGTLSVVNNASDEYIGIGGTAIFNQSNSYNSLNFGASFYVGFSTGSSGTYNLGAGGTLYNSLGSDYVGVTGAGTVVQTGGGNYIGTSTGTLYLGYAVGSTGSYSLQGGTLETAGDEVVAYNGSGSFTQSTSSGNTLNGCLDLYIGYSQGTTGSYALQGGTLAVSGNENEGYYGSSTFVQSGGMHTVGGYLTISNDASGVDSTYTLTGGTLAVTGLETVAENSLSTATFIQTGGLHMVGGLEMATDTSGGASVAGYFLYAGTLSAVGAGAIEDIGDDGIGNFYQSSGLNTDAGPLYLGSALEGVAGNTSSYTLTSGTLAQPVLTVSGGEYIGSGTYGNFFQYAGTNNANGPGLEVGGAGYQAYYLMDGGTLNAANINVSYAGTLVIDGGIVNSPSGTLTMASALPPFLSGSVTDFAGGELILAGLNTNGTSSLFMWTGGTLVMSNGLTFDSLAGPTSTGDAFGNSLTLNAGMALNVIGNETIGGTGGFTLTLNPGSIDTATGNLTVAPAGTLIQNGGPLSQTLTNNGTFNYNSGPFTGALNNLGQANINSSFTTAAGVSNMGNLNLTGLGSSLTLPGPGLFNGGAVSVNGGSITGAINNQGLITGFGTLNATSFTNSGTITQTGGDLFLDSTSSALANTGTINFGAGLDAQLLGLGINNDGSINLDGAFVFGAQVTNNADGVISGPGTLQVASFTNNGSLIVPGGTTKAGSFNNNGVIKLVSDRSRPRLGWNHHQQQHPSRGTARSATPSSTTARLRPPAERCPLPAP
jgi:fibronectin-binding autotransporter adhesin